MLQGLKHRSTRTCGDVCFSSDLWRKDRSSFLSASRVKVCWRYQITEIVKMIGTKWSISWRHYHVLSWSKYVLQINSKYPSIYNVFWHFEEFHQNARSKSFLTKKLVNSNSSMVFPRPFESLMIFYGVLQNMRYWVINFSLFLFFLPRESFKPSSTTNITNLNQPKTFEFEF